MNASLTLRSLAALILAAQLAGSSVCAHDAAEKMAEAASRLLAALTPEQSAHSHQLDLADADLKTIRKAGLDRIYFAWAGGLERGQEHYISG
ncbi:MAG: hypothetical protein ACYDH9_05250 [Limisphaerales bacterium]